MAQWRADQHGVAAVEAETPGERNVAGQQRIEAMHDAFGRACRARRQEYPFSDALIRLIPAGWNDRGFAHQPQRHAESGVIVRVLIAHDGIHAGLGDDGGQLPGGQVRRTNNDPPSDAVELEKG